MYHIVTLKTMILKVANNSQHVFRPFSIYQERYLGQLYTREVAHSGYISALSFPYCMLYLNIFARLSKATVQGKCSVTATKNAPDWHTNPKAQGDRAFP